MWVVKRFITSIIMILFKMYVQLSTVRNAIHNVLQSPMYDYHTAFRRSFIVCGVGIILLTTHTVRSVRYTKHNVLQSPMYDV